MSDQQPPRYPDPHGDSGDHGDSGASDAPAGPPAYPSSGDQPPAYGQTPVSGSAPQPYPGQGSAADPGQPSAAYPEQAGDPYAGHGYGSVPAGRHPRSRPGTVTAAAGLTWFLAGLTALLLGLSGMALLFARDVVIDELESQPGFEDAGIDPDAAIGAIAAVLGGFVLWCLIAIVLAVFAFRRSNGARIALAVSAVFSAILSLLAIGSLVSVVPLIGSVAVVVLLFTGGANEWYARRGSGSQVGAL